MNKIHKTMRKAYQNKWFRRLAPVLVILVWLAVAGVGGPTFGKINNVTKNDQASFLPANAESTKAQNIQQQFYDSKTVPAIVVIESTHKIEPQQLGQLAGLTNAFKGIQGVPQAEGSVAGPIPSKDGRAVEFIVQIDSSQEVKASVDSLRSAVNKNLPKGMTAYVTGPAGLVSDLITAFSGIDGILLVVALVAVFVILLLVYRSVLLPFMVLLTAMFALSAAILLVYQLALHNVIKLNGQTQGILSILVIGAATDYSLLFIARYKEALHLAQSRWVAVAQAYKGAFEPILASAATVIAALLCLLFSELNSNRSLGPIAGLGILFAFVAAMTLLPAMLVLLGRKAFWPVTPKYQPGITAQQLVKPRSLWGRVAHLVKHHYRRVWVICAVVLIAFAVGASQFKASGVSQTASLLKKSNAVDGQAVLAKHFSAGSGSPATVIVNAKDTGRAMQVLSRVSGVGQEAVYTGGSPYAKLPPKVVDGQSLINVTLLVAADSPNAGNTVTQLRQTLRDNNIQGLVGGESAIQLDSNHTANADLHKIVPIVLIVIFIILMLLLRSVVSAAILIGTVILSYLATLGVSALVFNHLFHFAGSDPAVPLFGFIFLVALGVDYNIFLMTRVREEAMHSTTRQAIIHALEVTGGVITSAGIVLAATFAALSVIPILFLAQIAFIVSFGVLLDTIVVRSLLLSSLTYDLGSRIWWPSARRKKP
ncbi:MAG: efflux RND transporter permease subunit [Candidatus Saccharimonadales bacterium]